MNAGFIVHQRSNQFRATLIFFGWVGQHQANVMLRGFGQEQSFVAIARFQHIVSMLLEMNMQDAPGLGVGVD